MARECLHHAGTTTSYTPSDSNHSLALQCPIPSLPIRFVAAEAGFFPPGPCIDFADMVCYFKGHAQDRCVKDAKLEVERGAHRA
jgi:hypothetical protein